MVRAGSPRIVRSAVGSASWARRARQSSKVSGHVTSAIASTHQPSEAAYRRPRRLRGTFLPFLRASDSPIAVAGLRLLPLPPLPPFPLLKVPCFRRRIAPSTSLLAPRLYFRRPDVFRAIVCPPYESVDEVSFLDQLAHLVGQHGQRDLLAVGLATDQRLRKMRQLLERDLGGHRRLEGIHDPLHNDRPGAARAASRAAPHWAGSSMVMPLPPQASAKRAKSIGCRSQPYSGLPRKTICSHFIWPSVPFFTTTALGRAADASRAMSGVKARAQHEPRPC